VLRSGAGANCPCRALLWRLITHAGTDPRVAALVYIAALAPDDEETSQSQQSKFPRTDVFGHIDVTDGRIWLKPSGLACFCGDLPEAEQKLVYATFHFWPKRMRRHHRQRSREDL
jgi:hypothetical protein